MEGQPNEPHHLDKPCDICGDVGSNDATKTCSKCCIAREHVYCMRIYNKVIPRIWVCEECLSRNNIVSPNSIREDEFLVSRDITHTAALSKGSVDSHRQFRHKKLKAVETGKVKYLAVDEASRLSSGAKGKQSHERNNSRTAMPSKNVISKFSIPRVKANPSFKLPVAEVSRLPSRAQGTASHESNNSRTAMPGKNVIPKSSILTVKANPNIKLPPHGGAQSIRKIDQQTAKTSEKLKGECAVNKWPGAAFMPAKEVKILKPKTTEVKTSNANADYAKNDASYGSSTPMCSIPIIKGQTLHADAGKNSSLEDRDLQNILPKLELFRKYLPSLEATWNGGFQFFGTATLGKFYGGFQAHPPCKIHCKAIEFSQKLPKDLLVKLLPRCPSWEDLFVDGSPDFHDIALYFFPADNTERSKQKYSFLLDFLETKNLVMRSYIDGVELLISTSKQLHVDCQKILARSKTQYFLWGVFRRAKADNILHKVHEELSSFVSPMECACYGHGNMDNDRVIDMDIDMQGGRSVGTVDMVVSKELSSRSRRSCGNPEKGNPGSATQNLLSEFKQVGRNNSDLLTKFPEKSRINFEHHFESSKGKMTKSKDEVVPPGFEKVLMRNSRIPGEKPESADRRVRNHMEVEKMGFRGVAKVAFGASSSQPQRSPQALDLSRSQKPHQEPASDPAHDPLTAYPRSPSVRKR